MKHRFLRHFMIIALCAALATGALRLAGPALADNEPPYTVTASGNTFTITRRDTSTAERISWRTVSISAIENVDYYRTCGTMNFAKDVATMTHTVTERDLSNLPLRYRYQTGTTRRYDFEITDEDGLTLASCAREISRAATQYPAEKIGPSGSDLIYIQFANLVNVYATGLDSKEFVDIPVTGDSYVKVTDAGYAQGVHTAPLDSLYEHVGLDQDYLEAIGDKVYAAAAFTMKEEEDGYQYIQILADNPDTFDPDDVDGTVAAPSASLYKACFELSGDTAITTTDYIQFFPHRYDYRDRKTSDLGPQWREFPTYNNFNLAGTWMHAQAFKDGYRADDAGALVLSPLTDSLNIRFDAVGKKEDDWYFKNLFVRAAVIDTAAPTLTPDNGCLVSVPGDVWCKGATVTVSLCFSEIVDNSHTTLHTTWGDLTFVQDGSLSNVAAWRGTITADPGVRLAITGLAGATQNQAGVISDCEGNSRALDAADLQRINARLDQTVTSPTEYSITCDLAGGSLSAANPAAYTYFTDAVKLNNPTRTGYEFLGWTGTGLGSAPVMSVTIPAGSRGDRNYTAHWALVNYSISYNLGSGAQVSPDNPTAYTVLSEGFTLNNPTRAGFEFLGWTGTDLGDEPVTAVTIPAGATGPRSYTAHWLPITYNIYYDLDGGSCDAFEAPSTYTGTQLPITLSEPVREGYDFLGWTGTGLGDVPVTDVTLPEGSTGDRNYTAHWALANYPISYDLGSGAQVSPDNPTAYTMLSEGFTLNNPTRAGFEFRGWTGTDLGDERVMSVTIPAGATGPRSYTAHWLPITYYIFYYLEDGEWDASEATSWYDGDQLPITLSKPVREGYFFAGWTGTGLGDKPVMDVTIPVGATGYRYYRANWVRMPENLSCFDPRSESSISFSDITMLASDSTEWTGSVAAWGCLTIGERVNVRGNVNLILMDDCDLTVTKGITVANGSSLNIFAQTPVYTADGDQPIGCLTITDPPEGFAGLGGEANTNAGEITILGGRVTVNAGSLGAAIGGATRGCADVTIYDGIITATSSDTGAAIGGGYYGCADVTIYDGIVTATSSDAGAAIGGGYASYVTSVDIKGGVVTAVAKDGAAIGTGSFSFANLWVGISGGSIDASTHGRGAAIGTGYDNVKASSAVITITGGDITALAAYGEAENPQSSASPGDTHGVTTYNPNSSAAVEYANKSNSAIGAGASTNATHAGVTINISGGTVTAIGENYAKGIGSKDDTVILSWISADAPNPCVTATGFADIVRLEKAFADKDHAGTIFHSAQLVPGSVLKDTTLVPCALPEYTVTVATEKEGEVDTYTVVSVGNVSYNDTLACAGETVEVTTSTYNNQLAGLTLSDGQETVALRYQPWTYGVAKASFTMPAADVTITALFTDHPVFCPYGLVLPAAVRTIEANAFEGDMMITAVDARSCDFIGPGAFKNCPRLIQIRVAKECVIDPTAFDEGASVQIFAPSGGAAETSCAAALGSCTFIPEEDG